MILLVVLFKELYIEYHWFDFFTEVPWNINMSSFVAVFVMVYICAEYTHGTLKNYVAVGFSRTKIYFAKLIKILVITFGFLFATQLFSLLFSPFVLNSAQTDFGAGLIYYFYGLLAVFELVCFYFAIAFITRKVGAVIGVYFGVSFGATLIDTLATYTDSSFIDFLADIFKYACYDLQVNSTLEIVYYQKGFSADVLFSIFVPLIVSAVSVFAGLYVFNKRDLR